MCERNSVEIRLEGRRAIWAEVYDISESQSVRHKARPIGVRQK